jgi:hypothetical protein
VLLLLGGKQHSYARGYMLCLYYTLCLMQLSVVRNLILMWCLDDIPESGLLVIDAVGWWSMYFVVMPRVNLIVILSSYARYLYSINCPTVISLPSLYYFILWRDTASELWTLVLFPLYCNHQFTLLALFTRILLSLSTRYAHTLCFKQTGEINNLIVSWEQSIWLCCVQVLHCYWIKTSQQVS